MPLEVVIATEGLGTRVAFEGSFGCAVALCVWVVQVVVR